jgi:hypothetical protein
VNILGWFLAVAGLVGLVFGLMQMFKMKKMGTVPFRRPSEIAQLGAGAADAKGMVSTEGQCQPGPEPLVAPMSGEACLAYEIVIERKWEKHETTEQGTQKRSGKNQAHSETHGTVFQITDGAGAVMVDTTGALDADMEKSHSSEIKVGNVIPGMLTFGRMQMNTPHIHDTEAYTVGFEGTEKIVRPSPTVYALGQLQPGQYGATLTTPQGLGTGKLILSGRGREKLLGSTKRNMILGYALGGVFALGGTGLGLFGPKAPPSSSCPSTIAATVECDDRIYERDGKDFTWQIDEKATYKIVVQQPAVKNPIDSAVTVTDTGGKKVAYDDGGAPGVDATIEQLFEPGTYTINVRDFAKTKVKGGYGFKLTIAKSAAPAASSASAQPVAAAPADATKPAAVKPGQKPKPGANGSKPATPSGGAAKPATGGAAKAPAGGAAKPAPAPAAKPKK